MCESAYACCPGDATASLWRLHSFCARSTGKRTLNQNENINSCPLCCAIDDRPLFIGDVNVNTILGHSGNFVIIPALGPLVVGHVLVVSSQHAEGLRYLTPEVQQNYKRL